LLYFYFYFILLANVMPWHAQGLPLREVSPTDPFGRGMSWKKEVLARKPVALAQPTNNEQ